MNVHNNTIVNIIYKRLSEEALTSSEQQQLLNWTQESEYNQQLLQQFADDLLLEKYAKEALSSDTLWNKFMEAVKGGSVDIIPASGGLPASAVHPVHFLKTAWFRYAAILLLITGTATFLYRTYWNVSEIHMAGNDMNIGIDIQPGGNKALLTLADGSTIVLDTAANGALALQGNTKIIKLTNGSLAYDAGTRTGGETGYNTISTPKGGQYQIVLPDNSKVWLNAASSIRFPTSFGKDRKIVITGEVYFEVVVSADNPFMVQNGATTIEVLGTSFNVNAYADEPDVKTSLLEGRVKIGTVVLKPGQAYVSGKVIKTDLQQDLAWKNGVFDFNHLSLEQALRQISKWYDVDVLYPQGIPAIRFGGAINRNLNFTELLHFLKGMGVHYQLNNQRQLVIIP